LNGLEISCPRRSTGPSSTVCRWSATVLAALVLLLAATITACGGSGAEQPRDPAATAHPPALDPTPRVLIMSAMRSEIDPLLTAATIRRRVPIGGRTHYVGRLGGRDVVLVAAGVSMVNAALGAQESLHHFTLTGIVFCGIAGGVNPGLDVGHVTIPRRWAQYQENWFTDDPAEQAERPLGHFGIMYPGPVTVTRHDGEPDTTERILWFPVDPTLLAAAQSTAGQSVGLDRCNRAGDCSSRQPAVSVGGNGVSGPTYVNDRAFRDWVWSTFEPDVLDMETAAVAHVAYSAGIPYIGVRAISDLAGGHGARNRMGNFTAMAARNAAAVTIAMLQQMASPSSPPRP